MPSIFFIITGMISFVLSLLIYGILWLISHDDANEVLSVGSALKAMIICTIYLFVPITCLGLLCVSLKRALGKKDTIPTADS